MQLEHIKEFCKEHNNLYGEAEWVERARSGKIEKSLE